MKTKSIYLIIGSLLLLRVSWLIHNGALSFFSSCHIQRSDQGFTLDAACLLQGKLPEMSLQEAVDLLRDDIIGFAHIYEPQSRSFIYTGSKAKFANRYPRILPETEKEIREMRLAAKDAQRVTIPIKQLAYHYVDSYAFYVADKDISQLKPCTKQNYQLALQSMDRLLLKPGQSFNYNRHLRELQGYCAGIDTDSRMFYGGVCGVSSQLFRVALIQPDIIISQRQPHNERFTVYYGEKIQGDDASVIEMRKQLEIKNNGIDPVYIRTKEEGNTTFIIMVAPMSPKQVKIYKEYKSDLEVELTRKIFQNEWVTNAYGIADASLSNSNGEKIIKKEVFSSQYIGKNNESR